MICKVKETITRNNLINANDNIILGLSGGVDSVFLFYILLNLQEEYNFKLFAIHVHHGLREVSADNDANFCKKLCEENNVDLKIVYENVRDIARIKKMSLEEAGRFARYNAFNNAFNEETVFKTRENHENFNKIALAHHKDDLAETILMNIIRGSGTNGLKGISYKRDNIIRPMLDISKKEIEVYCEKNKIPHCIDETNFETIYTRNKIRHELIPYIENNFNEKFVDNLINLRQISTENEEFINLELEKAYSKCLVSQTNSDIILNFKEVENYPVAIQKRIIRKAFFDLNFSIKDFTFKHVEDILNIMQKQSGKELNLPNSIKCVNSFGKLIFTKELNSKLELQQNNNFLKLKLEEVIEFDKYCLIISTYEEYKCEKNIFENNYKKICTTSFSYDKIEETNNLVLRNRLPGDKIYFNSISGSKKIKDLFSEKKIPKNERNNIKVLALENEILCVFTDNLIFSDYYKSATHEKKLYMNIWEENHEYRK